MSSDVESNAAAESPPAVDAPRAAPWELWAYRLAANAPQVVPAPARREWMDKTPARFATRCLPMMIANQAGWFILNPLPVRVTWNGGPARSDIAVEYLKKPPLDLPIVSYFGSGIVTWRINLLFRTSPGFDLWVRGPVNTPKPGAYALEGIVETHWSVGTFTMNWQLLTPNEPVVFEENEPISMVVPFRTGDLDQFTPQTASIGQNPELATMHRSWAEDRLRFLVERERGGYQKDYIHGRALDQQIAKEHRTRLHLRAFRNALPDAGRGATAGAEPHRQTDEDR